MIAGHIVAWWRNNGSRRSPCPAIGIVTLVDGERVQVDEDGLTVVGLEREQLHIIGEMTDSGPTWFDMEVPF